MSQDESPNPSDPTLTLTGQTPCGEPAPEGCDRCGQEVGSVKLISEIGRGGMGTVYLGHDRVLGRQVAVKFLNDAVTPDRSAVVRFIEEMRAAAGAGHPNLVQVYHADVSGNEPYLVMEYIQGPSLRQFLDHHGALGQSIAAVVLEDVAAAVTALHQRGLLHRDLKPGNVLLGDGTADSRVRVSDFGLAMRMNTPASATPVAGRPGSGSGSPVAGGTPFYMAPELFDGRASPRGDVYALGILTFELLTGRKPFTGSVDEVRKCHFARPLPLSALIALNVAAPLVELVDRATHKQAMFRYKTAGEFHRALQSASASIARQPGKTVNAERPQTELRRMIIQYQIDRGKSATTAPATSSVPTPTPTPTGSSALPASAAPISAGYEATIARFAANKRRDRPPG